jgi:hypothetical protein
MKYAISTVLAAALVAACALPAQANPGKAVVKAVTGTASYTDVDGFAHPVTVGAALKESDTITTGKDSSVTLFLDRNGPGVSLGANSVLRLERLSYEDSRLGPVIKTRLDLRQGEIYGAVNKLVGKSKYEVVTPRGLVEVRGTQFYVSARTGDVYVVSGTVTVTITWNVAGGPTQTRTVTVGAGQMLALSTSYTSITQIAPTASNLTPAQLAALAKLRLLTGYTSSLPTGAVSETFKVTEKVISTKTTYEVTEPPTKIVVSP